jgi:magnesium-transporting ATPase (P-type)
MIESSTAYWSQETASVLSGLGSSAAGLSTADAQRRLQEVGPNRLQERGKSEGLQLLLAQFKNPVILILLVAATLSIFLHDRRTGVQGQPAVKPRHYPGETRLSSSKLSCVHSV